MTLDLFVVIYMVDDSVCGDHIRTLSALSLVV